MRKMLFASFSGTVLGLSMMLIAPSPVSAACSARCQELCRQNPGPQTVSNCIKLWACINEKYPATAAQFANAAPPAECQRFFKPIN